MTTRESLARALCWSKCDCESAEDCTGWQEYDLPTRADDIATGLEDLGYTITPVEPTQEMSDAGWDVHYNASMKARSGELVQHRAAIAVNIYRAMLKASNPCN